MSEASLDITISSLLIQALKLYQNGQVKDAKLIYKKILSIDASDVQALSNLAMLEAQQGNYQQAIALMDNLLLQRPSDAVLLFNRGLALMRLGRNQEALNTFETAVSITPTYAVAHCCRGDIYHVLSKNELALESYDLAILYDSKLAQAYNNKANVLKHLGQFENALKYYEQAISLQPDYATAYYNRGVLLQLTTRYEEAIVSFDFAIATNPKYWEAYQQRGIIFHTLGRFNESLESVESAIKLNGSNPELHNNRGAVLQHMTRFQDALKSYDQALALNEGYYEAYVNRGVVLKYLRRLDEAIDSCDAGIRLKPCVAEGHWNKSLILLTYGKFSLGWEEYEWRRKKRDSKLSRRLFTQPSWTGDQSLQNKTIFIHAEQGLGDTIQFCRYIPKLATLGAKVILEVQAPVFNLLTCLEGVWHMIKQGEVIPDFDFHCPLLSLPFCFATDLDSIPAPKNYIKADNAKVRHWHALLGPKRRSTKLRVGVVWSSVSKFKYDSWRSMPLVTFMSGLPTDNIEYICLQKEIKSADRALLDSKTDIKFYGELLNDFGDTAALIENVDLVISTCTSVPHLSGALGKPTWILLSEVADWRWLLNRKDSPWYPNVKLYRQSVINDWTPVVAQVRADLKQVCSLQKI